MTYQVRIEDSHSEDEFMTVDAFDEGAAAELGVEQNERLNGEYASMQHHGVIVHVRAESDASWRKFRVYGEPSVNYSAQEITG